MKNIKSFSQFESIHHQEDPIISRINRLEKLVSELYKEDREDADFGSEHSVDSRISKLEELVIALYDEEGEDVFVDSSGEVDDRLFRLEDLVAELYYEEGEDFEDVEIGEDEIEMGV